MIRKRVIVAWMTLLALVFASAGASARTDVDTKPHVEAIDVVAATCIEVHGLASAEEHQGILRLATTETSDVPDAARGAETILSNQAAGKIIGWPTGQATAGKTAEMARNLTAQQVSAMRAQGLNRTTVEHLRASYQKAIETGGAKLKNEQLLPRTQLMDRILELWPK